MRASLLRWATQQIGTEARNKIVARLFLTVFTQADWRGSSWNNREGIDLRAPLELSQPVSQSRAAHIRGRLRSRAAR